MIAGDMIAVESLLAQPEINVNVLGVMDRMALHWAAFFGHTEIARVLLAQPNIELNAFDTVSIMYLSSLYSDCTPAFLRVLTFLCR